jgi:F0F1-type ATP synthase delta subunit
MNTADDFNTIMESEKLMEYFRDRTLTREQKLVLMNNISKRHKERWAEIKRFHSFNHISMHDRHFFMKRIITLMSEQNERLKQLMKDIQLNAL